MVTQNRRIGGKKHEQLLKQTMKRLTERRYRVIDLEGKSPTLIATKDGLVIAVRLGCKPTHTKLKQMYPMFDEIKRIDYLNNDETREEWFKRVISDFETKGYRVIRLNHKSPDAIAVKDDKIYAIEILGVTHIKDGKSIRNRKNWAWSEKQNLYSMFDGLMIKTFFYNHDDILTDIFTMHPTTTYPGYFADGTFQKDGHI